MNPYVHRGTRGMTLIEMLLAMLILLSTLAAAFRLLEIYHGEYFKESARAEAQQSGRAAVEILSREIRSAGEGVPRSRPCHAWAADESPVTISAGMIRMLSNVKSIHNRLAKSADAGQTKVEIFSQEQIDASGYDWSPARDFEKNKMVYLVDAKDPANPGDDHIECFQLSVAGSSERITLPAPLAAGFPQGSRVEVINEISYSVNAGKQLLRKIDGASSPVAEGISLLAFSSVPRGVKIDIETVTAGAVRRWSTRVGFGVGP